jgi:hypothetical protein
VFWKEHINQKVRVYLIGSEHWIEGIVESIAEDYVVISVELKTKRKKNQKRFFYYRKVSIPLINVLFVLFDICIRSEKLKEAENK